MTAVLPEATSAPRTRRLVGLDLARFLAIVGMLGVHFGIPVVDGRAEHATFFAFSGRSTALFTVLAGVSLALLSGRTQPPTGEALRSARTRIAVRGSLLILLGIALAKATEATGFLLTIIIAFYGLYFLLSLPFVGMPARGVAIAAGTALVLGPQLSFVLRNWLASDDALTNMVTMVNSVDPGHLIAHLGLVDMMLYDFYPAASYLGLVLAGMAIGRCDLRDRMVRLKLGVGGLATAVVAYASSTLLVRLAGVRPQWGPDGLVPPEGTVAVGHGDWLLAATPHSGSTFEMVGGLGVCMAVLALCLELADHVGRVLKPFALAGSMGLTLYALHAMVMAWQVAVGGWPLSGVSPELAEIAALGPASEGLANLPAFPEDGSQPTGFVAWLNIYMSEVFLVFSVLFAVLWSRRFTRGPIEAAVSESVRWVCELLPHLKPKSLPRDA